MSEKPDIPMSDKIRLSNENNSEQPAVIINKDIEYKQNYCENCHKENSDNENINSELNESSIKNNGDNIFLNCISKSCSKCVLTIKRYITCYTSNKKIELSEFDNTDIDEVNC
jgi:hypothetical protein